MSERSHKSRSTQRYEVTDTYRDNFAAIFGDKPAEKGSYVFDSRTKHYVPAAEYVPPEGESARGRCPVVSDLYMDGDRATDGTDIGNRRKRREYMTANNVSDMSDWTNHLAQKQKERREFFEGRARSKATREEVERVAYRLEHNTQKGR